MHKLTSLPRRCDRPPRTSPEAIEREARRPWAVLACDLDPVDCHLAGYGVDDAPHCDVIYRRAIPRLLDLLDELGLHAVFFVVARDAVRQRDLLRRIACRGHEIASHSLTHPQPFRALDDTALARETATSRRVLSDVIGAPIFGFRAPAWDVDTRVLQAVAAAGYRYDGSVFPSPVLALARLFAHRRASSDSPVAAMKSLYAWAPTGPHCIGNNGTALMEFPVAVTPRLRLPVYHTMSHLLPRPLFDRALGSVLRTPAFSYELHAADLLGLEEDDVDRRLAVHPGMKIPLARKLATLRGIFARIARQRTVKTYRQVLIEGRAEPVEHHPLLEPTKASSL